MNSRIFYNFLNKLIRHKSKSINDRVMKITFIKKVQGQHLRIYKHLVSNRNRKCQEEQSSTRYGCLLFSWRYCWMRHAKLLITCTHSSMYSQKLGRSFIIHNIWCKKNNTFLRIKIRIRSYHEVIQHSIKDGMHLRKYRKLN